MIVGGLAASSTHDPMLVALCQPLSPCTPIHSRADVRHQLLQAFQERGPAGRPRGRPRWGDVSCSVCGVFVQVACRCSGLWDVANGDKKWQMGSVLPEFFLLQLTRAPSRQGNLAEETHYSVHSPLTSAGAAPGSCTVACSVCLPCIFAVALKIVGGPSYRPCTTCVPEFQMNKTKTSERRKDAALEGCWEADAECVRNK